MMRNQKKENVYRTHRSGSTYRHTHAHFNLSDNTSRLAMERFLDTLEGASKQLRPVVPLLLALALLLGFICHALSGPSSSSGPHPGVAPPEETGLVPPLPVVEDIAALSAFVRESLDDVVEDAAKLTCVILVYSLSGASALFSSAPSAPFSTSLSPALRTVGRAASVVLAYVPCDYGADILGDEIQRDVNAVLSAVGLSPEGAPLKSDPASQAALPQHSLPLRVLDDLTEDGFKLVCLAMHGHVGALLSNNLARSVAVLRHVRFLVYLGVPAARYTACNRYGDFLGDWVQSAVQAALTWSGK